MVCCSGSYLYLSYYLGVATAPGDRGRTRYALDAGTGRITGAMAAGNTLLSGDGDQYLMAHTHTGDTGVESVGHTHNYLTAQNKAGTSGGGGAVLGIWNDAALGPAT